MKKKRNLSQHNSFWISISDLMAGITCLILLFIVFLSFGIKSERQEFERVKEDLQSAGKTQYKILKSIQEKLTSLGVQAQILPELGVLRLQENTLKFQSAESTPTQDSIQFINQLGQTLGEVLPCYSRAQTVETSARLPKWCKKHSINTRKCDAPQAPASIEAVMIEGHTDNVPVKETAAYNDNMTLSALRAATVWNIMKSCSPSLVSLYNRKNQKLIGIAGYSSQRLAYPNPRDPRNRRIDIRIIMHPSQIASHTSANKKI